MKYFVTAEQRKSSKSSCYFEFMQGKYEGKNWLQGSVCISADLFEEAKLYNAFSALPDFAYYGVTEIDRDRWSTVMKQAEKIGGKTHRALSEIADWAENTLADFGLFTLCGI